MSIWHRDETPGYDKGKADTSFSKWRVLVMERVAEITGLGEEDSVARLHRHGLARLGVDFDKGVTASKLATQLARRRAPGI